MAKIIIETQYLPTIAFYSFAINETTLLIDQHEHYQKGGYRNRAEILSAQGKLTLSIPLQSGKNNQTPIREVIIDHSVNWNKNHLQTIKSCYGKAPFFEFYFPDIELILNRKHQFLFDLNHEIIEKLNKWLGVEDKVNFSDHFYSETTQGIQIMRNLISPKTRLRYQLDPFFNFLNYEQVFSEVTVFEPNLSILDLLMCKGPESRIYLSEIWK